MFIGFLTSLDNAYNHEKCVSLINQKRETQPTLINSNNYTTIHLMAKSINRCVGSCNILNDRFDKVCVPNKTKDLYLSAFNMITRINE